MKTLTITRASLHVALLTWAIEARKGETLTHGEADAKPVHEIAEESAAHLWALLEQGAGAASIPAYGQKEEPMKPLRLSREQVDEIFDGHREAPTLQFRYLIADAIIAELQRRRCWQINSGRRCDLQRAPGERRCPDCNPGAPK